MVLKNLAFLVMAAVLLAACGKGGPAEEASSTEEAGQPEVVVDDTGMAAGEDVAPLEASDAPPYVGVWAADPAICGLLPGSADPAPIAISESEFIGYENYCRIAYVDETGPMMWNIERICEAEGVEYTEIMGLEIVNGDLLLKSPDADAPAEFIRCS